MADFYARLAERNDDFRSMRVLAEHVVAQLFAASIFAATSGTALLVVPRPDAHWVQDGLRIDVDFAGTINFVVEGRPPAKRVVTRFEGGRVIAAFDAFLRDAKWVR